MCFIVLKVSLFFAYKKGDKTIFEDNLIFEFRSLSDFYKSTINISNYVEFIILPENFKDVKIYPVRGRLSSAMHILFGSMWKKTFEKLKFNLFLDRFFSKNKNSMQTGGYNFIAIK